MKKIKILAVALAALSSVVAFAGLGVGDAAPALKVAKWNKGTPVKGFAPGKVYVVEFWATWCGPCKTSIPHLTELAKKYAGKVSVVGVSVWETDPKKPDNAYMAKVDKFVKDMGAKMDYHVASDDLKGTMAKSWMEAAGQDGIPAAFVVNQEGKIAWIGHPMSGLDEVLEKVVAGKYDIAGAKADSEKEAKARAEMQAQQEGIQKDMGEVMQLMQAGKKAEAQKKLDEVIVKYPAFKTPLVGFKFQMLLENDEPAAYKFAKEMGETDWKDNAQMLNQIAWTIVEAKAPIKKPDFDVAIALAQRGADITKDADELKPMVLDTLAFAYWKKGDKAKALEVQTKAVDLLKNFPNLDADTKKELTERLEMFKKG